MAEDPTNGTDDVLAGLGALMGVSTGNEGDDRRRQTPPPPEDGFTDLLERCERTANGL